jgi:uncharacterized protein YacL
MSAELISRIIGFIIFAIIGWSLGTLWAGTSELDLTSLRYILPLAILGGVIGAFVAPWITTKPAAYIRRVVREINVPQLLAASLGLGLGLVVAALASIPLSSLPYPFRAILPTIVAIIFGYIGMTIMVLRQKDILALFRRRQPGGEIVLGGLGGDDVLSHDETLLLDTSVIIDGRIADVAQTGFLRAPLLVPRFILAELQHIADSPDALRRNRGRRGLEMLNRMQKDAPIPVRIIDADVEGARQVDAKLVQLARQLGAAIVTNDYNLNRVAGLQGVQVLNINELSNAVKSVVLPGEALQVKVIQEGKESGQGIGYLDDGTMVVVENGRKYIDSDLEVTVTKVLQTNAGRMVFAAPSR